MKRHHPRLLSTIIVISLLNVTASFAAPGDDAPDADTQTQPVTVVGRVESFNLNNQRGSLDGLILQVNGQRVQVNLADSIVDAVGKAVGIGDIVQARVLPEGGPGGPGGPGRGGRGGRGDAPNDGRGGPPPPQEQPADHPVYRAQAIRDSRGQIYTAPEAGQGETAATINDTIRAFNYDHRGTINGLQLGKGDLVHLPGNAASQLTLRPGDRVTIEGTLRPMATGKARVIEAQSINGTAVRGGPGRGGPEDGPPPDDRGGGGARGGRGGGRGPDAGGPGPGEAGPDDEPPPPGPEDGPPPPGPDEGPGPAVGPGVGPGGGPGMESAPPPEDAGDEPPPPQERFMPGPGPQGPMEGPDEGPPDDDGNE